MKIKSKLEHTVTRIDNKLDDYHDGDFSNGRSTTYVYKAY